ncbi:MAG TPA: AAA family ATPase, partial [Anaerolineales bacterium]|nr:AAA family ATPase [Anaerolineales bacterium]
MSTPVLATKLYIPPPRPKIVLRPRLLEPLKEGLHRKLTLLSAPAGFGKTTILSEWIASFEQNEPRVRAAWVSLDEGDNDPARFLTYFIAAVQTLGVQVSTQVLGALQNPQLPPIEDLLTRFLNDLTAYPEPFILVLDDYHVIEARPVNDALAFLLKHLPPQMHLVIVTREDPDLPLARLRARNQLTELRATDLRFTLAEATRFLNQAMELNLSAPDVAALETRTEGWIAGLQLAALALQALPPSLPELPSSTETSDVNRFIQSFTGSHRFIMDYLVEEVLQQQPETVQTFLLST